MIFVKNRPFCFSLFMYMMLILTVSQTVNAKNLDTVSEEEQTMIEALAKSNRKSIDEVRSMVIFLRGYGVPKEKDFVEGLSVSGRYRSMGHREIARKLDNLAWENFNRGSYGKAWEAINQAIREIDESVDNEAEVKNIRLHFAAIYKALSARFIQEKAYIGKDAFKLVQDKTQEKIDWYLIPRSVLHVNTLVPQEIKKPYLPAAPTLVKSQFETKVEFEQRVNSAMTERDIQIKDLQEKYRRDVEARNQKIEQLRQAYAADVEAIKREQSVKMEKLSEKLLEFTREAFFEIVGEPVIENPVYDAETETMQVDFRMSNVDYKKRVDLKVPRAVAQTFHANIDKAVPIAVFTMENSAIKLNAIKAIYDKKTYVATLTEKQFQPEKIEVALKDTKVDFKAGPQANLELQNPNLIDTYRVSSITYGESASASGKNYTDDLKPLIVSYHPKPVDPKKWLFMIAVEYYNETDPVIFAKSSAEAFRDTAQKAFGIDPMNTIALIDDKATSVEILRQLDYMLKERLKEGDEIYFYYIGHGVPDTTHDGEAYILPKDNVPDWVSKDERFKLSNIYKQLTDSKASKVVAFVDACFSGRTDMGQIYKGTAASIMKSKKIAFNESKMTILVAAKDNQFANAYDEKGHRLFSYFVMKSLLSGRDTVDSLYKEVSLKVHDESAPKGPSRLQEPQIYGNKNIGL